MTGILRAALPLAILLGAPAVAHAHAFLERAAPAVGGRVHGAPGEVRLRFNERLEPGRCSVKVLDARGERMDTGVASMDDGDRQAVFVALRPVPAGVYKVIWRVVSGDGHATEGDFTFEVVP